MRNIITVDVEEWYEYYGVWLQQCGEKAAYRAWRQTVSAYPSLVASDTERTLRGFDAAGCRATFFVLGTVAREHPGLLRTLRDAGHEIGIHGDEHTMFTLLSPEEQYASVERAVEAVWDAASVRPVSFRAPCYSLHRGMSRAFAALADSGIRFDSSIFPVHHPSYGEPDAPRGVYTIETGGATPDPYLVEFPPATWRVGPWNIPVGSSTYLRLLPLRALRQGIAQLNRAGEPATLVFHTWETNPEETRLPTSLLMNVRHRFRRRAALSVLQRLMAGSAWGGIEEAAARLGETARPPVLA